MIPHLRKLPEAVEGLALLLASGEPHAHQDLTHGGDVARVPAVAPGHLAVALIHLASCYYTMQTSGGGIDIARIGGAILRTHAPTLLPQPGGGGGGREPKPPSVCKKKIPHMRVCTCYPHYPHYLRKKGSAAVMFLDLGR